MRHLDSAGLRREEAKSSEGLGQRRREPGGKAPLRNAKRDSTVRVQPSGPGQRQRDGQSDQARNMLGHHLVRPLGAEKAPTTASTVPA